MPLPARLGALLLALASCALCACKTSYTAEEREASVEVVLEAPAAREAPLTVPVLVYVGERKAVDGSVSFGPGRTRQILPPVYVRGGGQPVSVVLAGREAAKDTIRVRHHAWVLVTIRGDAASVEALDQMPGTR